MHAATRISTDDILRNDYINLPVPREYRETQTNRLVVVVVVVVRYCSGHPSSKYLNAV